MNQQADIINYKLYLYRTIQNKVYYMGETGIKNISKFQNYKNTS